MLTLRGHSTVDGRKNPRGNREVYRELHVCPGNSFLLPAKTISLLIMIENNNVAADHSFGDCQFSFVVEARLLRGATKQMQACKSTKPKTSVRATKCKDESTSIASQDNQNMWSWPPIMTGCRLAYA